MNNSTINTVVNTLNGKCNDECKDIILYFNFSITLVIVSGLIIFSFWLCFRK